MAYVLSSEERRLLVDFVAHVSPTFRRRDAYAAAEAVVARMEAGVQWVRAGRVEDFDPAVLVEWALRWRRGEPTGHEGLDTPPAQRWVDEAALGRLLDRE